MELGAGMVIETVDDIINDSVTTIPQDALIDGGADTLPAPKIFKDTCHIDWNKGAESIYNLIRGLSPYPAAWSSFEKDGKEYSVKIFSTSLPMKCSDTKPGKVSVEKNRIFVDCADGKLEILSLQQSGKRGWTQTPSQEASTCRKYISNNDLQGGCTFAAPFYSGNISDGKVLLVFAPSFFRFSTFDTMQPLPVCNLDIALA